MILLKMLHALTSAYTKKDYHIVKEGLLPTTNIGKLFFIYAWGLEQANKDLSVIKLWDDLDHAKGEVLDRYGDNFGVKRIGKTDEFYRLAIKVKMLSLLSGGDIDTVIRAVSTLLEINESDIEFNEIYPAKIALKIDINLLTGDKIEFLDEIVLSIKRILAAGVGINLYVRTRRSFKSPLAFGFWLKEVSNIHSQPISKDRLIMHNINVANAIKNNSVIIGTPIGRDRSYAEKTNRGARVIYQTRIKSKFIE